MEIKNVLELLAFHSPDAQQNGSKSFPRPSSGHLLIMLPSETLFEESVSVSSWSSPPSERAILQKEGILCFWFKGS